MDIEATACLLIAEHDAAQTNWQLSTSPAGAALLMQQPGESAAQILHRASSRARDLRDSGYLVDSASFVLGSGGMQRLDDRITVAQGLMSLLSPKSAPFRLISTSQRDRLTPFLMADRLHQLRPHNPIQIRFQPLQSQAINMGEAALVVPELPAPGAEPLLVRSAPSYKAHQIERIES